MYKPGAQRIITKDGTKEDLVCVLVEGSGGIVNLVLDLF